MAGWLWVVAAVVLGVVIFLLLRSRGGTGRHRASGRGVRAAGGGSNDVEPGEEPR